MANEFKVKKGLIVQGSGSTGDTTILDVQGNQGQLFSITDSLEGTLFSVSDISGIPILDVNSNETVKIGTFGNEGIIVNGSNVTSSGHISASGTITANAFVGDGSNITGISGTSDNNFTTTLKNKLDAIEASADVTDATNVTAAGALMDSELSSITDVKALNQSVISGATPTFTTTNFTDASNKRFMTDAQETKLDSVESSADVTDTTNVTAAGALMDSELTSIANVKALNQSVVSGATPTFTTTNFTDASNKRLMTDAQETKLDSVESSADVTDATNVTAAGALMDSELSEIATVKALTGAGISGSFTAASASFSTRVTTNDAKLTADTTNVTAAGALMDSELTSIADVKALNQSVISGATPTFTTTNFTDASNKRLMTDAQETKLDSVESSADVTDTTNVTAAGALMDSEVTNLADVKAFDTTDYATSTQGTTADAALPKAGGAMTGAITTNSTFDGRDVATDGTKLDGIEANATADQSNAEIRTAVEAATDSNVFTDADHTKLNAIEASADVTDTTNVTAAGALMDSELTSIADVKALNQSVVSGATPTFTTTNFTDATNKRFMTDAQETKLDSVASSANNYVLPTNLAGDDIDIDTGALTGATVISDLDINITTNTSGLVTDANASVATRTLTAANLSLGNVTNESKATMFTSPTFTGTVTTPLSKIGWRNLDWAGNIAGNSPAYAQGDVIYHASSVSTVAGSIYYMLGNGNIALADADAVSTSSTLIVVALSTNANLGLLLRGTVVLRTNPGGNPGVPLYLSTTAGEAQTAAPTATGDVVRVLGYQLTNGEGTANVCYFNPDNTWVELT